ncbi:MAG: acyltransferase, partial [Acidimicrobiia bacterium]|nr:acyltransferase [Acidimicrobiia bacterium]
MRERRQVTGRPSSGGFGYQPALDGVRALAVAMVLVFHGGFGWMSGGYVGVSVFFTLSGYLITSLALVEHDATGRFSARAFYQRRIRRLLPASLVCLSGVIAAARVGWFEPAVHLRRDLWAAVTQVYNWSALAGDETYAEIVAGGGARARPLDHYWSLAIEEQFYWVWPLLLLVILRWSGRVRLAAIGGLTAATGVAAPLIAAAWGGDAAYWATPARLAEILVGATLAVILHRWSVSGSRGVGLLAPIGVVAIVGAGVTWPADSGPAYTGWLPVFALASAALIVGLQVAGPVRRVLSWRPLVALGAVSYGVYLYHWPIFGLLDERVLDWGRVALFALRVVVTIAVAAASYLLAERPIRRGRRPVVTVFR